VERNVLFSFNDFTLDIGRRELRRGAAQIALEPQVFDLLVYLIENRDRVVSRDDLIASVWGGRVVSESTLASRICAARRALGDSGEAQRLIKTVQRKGVRFVGEARQIEDALRASRTSQTALLAVRTRSSVAVLPLADLSGGAEQDYFAEGVTEEIIIALSVDAKDVARELGVRYVLSGSVRLVGMRRK
jgi:DNA-binding winged helix-turn-helix (wHTH) protein